VPSDRRFSLLPRAESGSAPEWAITYADLITLVLIFFIALFSYSSMDAAKYRALSAGMRQAFGSANLPYASAPKGLAVAEDGTSTAGIRAEQELEGLAASGGPGGPFEIYRSAEGLRLRVTDRLMFGVASAEMAPQAAAFLNRLAPILSRYPYRVEVQGHTDGLPIRNQIYPSNWELSAARAGTVVRELIARGVPGGRLSAVGFADTHPVASEDDPAGRGRNRRVEFLLTRPPDKPVSARTALDGPPAAAVPATP
jgi:chemotaxis protein MotB